MNLDPDKRRIDAEIRHHLEELEEQLIGDGMSRDDARAEAGRRFGNPAAVAEQTRQVAPKESLGSRLGHALDTLRQDTVFALRQLRRQPLVTLLTLGTLVTGVAATAVVYSVVHGVVLAPLPFEDPDNVVIVDQLSPQGFLYGVSDPNLIDFQLRQRSFEGIAGFGFGTNPILETEDGAEALSGMAINHNFFPILGLQPLMGRHFLPEEDRADGPDQAIMVSETAWRNRFGEDPNLVGKTLLIDGHTRNIVGVMRSDHVWNDIDVFLPLRPDPDSWRDDQRIQAVARLSPGVTLAEARVDMSDIAAQLSDEYPDSNDQWGASVRTAKEWLVGPQLTRLGGFLLAAVGLFLLMACASVSNLLLAKATARIDEISVRAAVGAGRKRIAAQLGTEGVILAVAGTGLALLVAPTALDVVRAVGPDTIARLEEIRLSGRVLGVAVAAAFLTVMVAGLAPGALLMGGNVFTALRSGRRSGSQTGDRLRKGLILAQFGLAVTVLLSAGLLTRSFVEMQHVDLGFEPESVARFAVRLPGDRFTGQDRLQYLDRVEDELGSVPGVIAAGATHAPPYSRFRPSNFTARSDNEPDRQMDFTRISWRAVTPGYFEAAGIELVAGRTFERYDRLQPGEEPTNPPIVIDEELAAALFPNGENPIGKHLTWFLPGGWQCEVIGVVRSTRDERVDQEPRPRVYRTFSFTNWAEPTVLVRTSGDPGDVMPAIRRSLLAIDPSVPPIAPDLLTTDLAQSVAWPRFSMQVLSAFALIALLLASMGIYGVTAFAVAQRRREIGVRVALGAEPGEVRWMVVRKAMRLALVGVAAGVVASIGVSTFLESLLYEVSTTDPLTFMVVPLALLVVAMGAAWIPAQRALRVNPQEALRAE